MKYTKTSYCLDSRREITSNRFTEDEVTLKHLKTCTDCQGFQQELQTFDQQLQDAIKIDVPEGLAD